MSKVKAEVSVEVTLADGKRVVLTEDEARVLYNKLSAIFDKPPNYQWPSRGWGWPYQTLDRPFADLSVRT